MKRLCGATALVCTVAAMAAPEYSGQVRPVVTVQDAATLGPMAAADEIAPGTTVLPVSNLALETELRAQGSGLHAVATLIQQRLEHRGTSSSGWFNELYAAGGSGGWQFSAGQRIVAWDVGYGFRPNDVVEQETRRRLLPVTADGRRLLAAEYFNATDSAALVLVNPEQPRTQTGEREPALALRLYRRAGSVDLYGFARQGARTGGSIGAAAAWVAGDALELHASVRAVNAADTLAPATGLIGTSGLARTNPWIAATRRRFGQALVGGTWTSADQLSLLVEAWWDGSALSSAQWQAWNDRNAQLRALAAGPAPAAAVAGNLAWQGQAFNASTNLRRDNLYARLSWTHEHWEPAIDCLFEPSDGGRVCTATLGWQGDRVRIDAGWRGTAGPATAVLPQTPTRRVAYAALAWTF
ncbi:MAG: hypothetical protein KGN16_01725 [Burkholderiales bacterium]|nr:hypothetical protein [Burkholderiales bacterium]